MADVGKITIGVRVLDERTADMTQYVSRKVHDKMRRDLIRARADADRWEAKYHELAAQQEASR